LTANIWFLQNFQHRNLGSTSSFGLQSCLSYFNQVTFSMFEPSLGLEYSGFDDITCFCTCQLLDYKCEYIQNVG